MHPDDRCGSNFSKRANVFRFAPQADARSVNEQSSLVTDRRLRRARPRACSNERAGRGTSPRSRAHEYGDPAKMAAVKPQTLKMDIDMGHAARFARATMRREADREARWDSYSDIGAA
jgi:hypothetical protein